MAGKGRLSVDQPRRRWALRPDPLEGDDKPTIAGRRSRASQGPACPPDRHRPDHRLGDLVRALQLGIAGQRRQRFNDAFPGSKRGTAADHTRSQPTRNARCSICARRPASGGTRSSRIAASCWFPIPRTRFERPPSDRRSTARSWRARLANIDKMGAKAIGIDILIDQPQPEDPQLLATLKTMKTPVWLAYATRETAGDEIELWQQQFMDRWFASACRKQCSARLGPVRNRRRQCHPPLAIPAGRIAPAACRWRWPAHGRDFNYPGSIDFQAPANPERLVFNALMIDNFADPALAPLLAEQVKGRIVLIGGDFPDRDRFEIPATRLNSNTTISGLEVHATMIAQILDRRLPTPAAPPALWALAVLVVLCGAFTAMLDVRPWVVALAVVGQLAFFAFAPFYYRMARDRHLRTAGVRMAGRLVPGLCGDRRRGSRGRLRATPLCPVGPRQISAARHCRADPARSEQIVADRRDAAALHAVHRYRGIHRSSATSCRRTGWRPFSMPISTGCATSSSTMAERSTSSSATRWSPSGARRSPARTTPIARPRHCST